MKNDKDDGATVVIDIKQLKKQFEDVSQAVVDIEFSADLTKEIKKASYKLFLFDFKSSTLSNLKSKGMLPHESLPLTSLNELNQGLKENPDAFVLFNYHIETQNINKLIAQIKKLYPKAQLILMAKGLNENFIQKHSQSPMACNHYLSFPFELTEIERILQNL